MPGTMDEYQSRPLRHLLRKELKAEDTSIQLKETRPNYVHAALVG
jgi:hypothetical protein